MQITSEGIEVLSVRVSGVCAGLVLLFLAESANALTLWEWWMESTGVPGAQASTFVRALRTLTLPFFNLDEFDPKKVRLVDQVGQNVIIRMPNPAIKGAFAEQAFYDAIQSVLPEGMSKDLSTRKIISFNLMHPWAEYEEYSVEKSWFKAEAKNNREFRNYPQLGSFLPATWLPKWARDFLVPYRRHLGLSTASVVQDLRSEVLSQEGVPKIIVVHCVSGRDRTGMIVGEYRVAYMGKSYEEVVKENQEVAGKSQDYWSRNSLRWMALRRARLSSSVGQQADILKFNDKDLSHLPQPIISGHAKSE